MDLHYQYINEAKDLVEHFLTKVQKALDDDEIAGNTGKDHVYKIICGAGKHSNDGAKLKFHIADMLRDQNYDIYEEKEHGIILVKLTK